MRRPYSMYVAMRVWSSLVLVWSWKTAAMCGSIEMPPL